jgi:signal transduction histidine kinase
MNEREKSKILVVEDEAIVARDIQNCLKGLGYEVAGIAASGEVAVAKAKELSPDLVLMDITLKDGMNGIEAASLIRLNSDIPVVFLTAHADEYTLERARKAEAYGFIIKPFEEREIRTSVEIALYKHKMELKLSEYDRARREAERSYQEADAAIRLRDEFLATVSHELRTPLNPILGYLDLLKSKEFDNQHERDNALDVIYRNAKALNRLVADLLDTSRIITGKLELKSSNVHLSDIARSAVESLDLAAKSKQIKVQIVIEGSVRPVFGDQDRLQQVFWNLLSNAIKFTSKGGLIQIIIRDRHSKVEVSIHDTGEGIDPRFLPHIFERFRQEDGSYTRAHGGLGLGLAIVRHIVEVHGGEVAVTSEGKGKGSIFTVRMPVSAVIGAEGVIGASESKHLKESDSPSRPEIGKKQVLSGLHILVVEDSPDSRELVKMVLERFGASVVAVESANLALEQLRKARPDVVLCDIGMPEMDGYSFIRLFRSMEQPASERIPAAALTAHIGEEDRKRAIESGFEEHIPKPVEANMLVDVITRLTKRSATAR